LDRKLLTAEHPEFEHPYRAWNLAVQQQPEAVVATASVDDVVAVVALAQTVAVRRLARALDPILRRRIALIG